MWTRIADNESINHVATLDNLIPAFFAAGGISEQLCEIVRRTDDAMSLQGCRRWHASLGPIVNGWQAPS